jgi:hypothetical protein
MSVRQPAADALPPVGTPPTMFEAAEHSPRTRPGSQSEPGGERLEAPSSEVLSTEYSESRTPSRRRKKKPVDRSDAA